MIMAYHSGNVYLSTEAKMGKNVPRRFLKMELSSMTGLNHTRSSLASILWLSTRPLYSNFINPSQVISLIIILCVAMHDTQKHHSRRGYLVIQEIN